MDVPPELREILEDMPQWLKLPVPPNANAVPDKATMAKLLPLLDQPIALMCFSHRSPFLVNVINAVVFKNLISIANEDPKRLFRYAGNFPRRAELRVLRFLVKNNDWVLRLRVNTRLKYLNSQEVALPRDEGSNWDPSGWLAGLRIKGQTKNNEPPKLKEGLPELSTVGDLREFLEIKSSDQLGWFLLATDGHDRPYYRFEIPKRNGQPRQICAPHWQLREVQRRILEGFLEKIPVHDCAHGFVPGRSIYTNASAHVGNELVLKFDL